MTRCCGFVAQLVVQQIEVMDFALKKMSDTSLHQSRWVKAQ